MQRIICTSTAIVLAALGSGCSQEVTAPAGDIMLSSLRFTRAEAQVGEPLVLVAQPAAGESLKPQPLLVTASSGAQQRAIVSPWDNLSDAELTAVIADVDGEVLIGFKEADAVRGVDEQGRSVTSAETVERMKRWLTEQAITIIREWVLAPGVFAKMPADEALVSQLRDHDNIDQLEPNIVGEFPAVTDARSSGGLAGVIRTSPGSAGNLAVRPGDRVTAEYRQPDGSSLTATVAIRR